MGIFSKFLENFFLKFKKANFIFEDYYRNKYYELLNCDHFGRKTRYVVYYDKKDASFIPLFCDQWLRHVIDNDRLLQINQALVEIKYLKPHRPNLTGTKFRFLPNLHPLKRNVKLVGNNDSVYQEWVPH